MTQEERRLYLIKKLLCENEQYSDVEIPENEEAQKRLLRSLFNVRMPKPIPADFLRIQDEYLRSEIESRGITDLRDIKPRREDIYVWQGDITTLSCDAIVNAANSELLGCFYPCHRCIDNAIHTFSGIQLRLSCAELMRKQGHSEKTGQAKITPAYNLPCRYVLHTVGPIIRYEPTRRDCDMLASCYSSCLKLAEQNGVLSIAFPCISTGEFHFPNERAAEIAIETVNGYKTRTGSRMKVIFNVFKDLDYEIYRELLR